MDKQFSTLAAAGRNSDEVSFADTVFGFWEDFQPPPENSSDSGDDDNDDESFFSPEKDQAFWDEQDQLLKATLGRTSSREHKIRQATKEALRELNMPKMLCICRRPVVAKGCRSCLQREICDRLLKLGYNCAVCISKWRSSSQIPSGEHTYLEVTDNSASTKGGAIKVVIELNLRAEFEISRANEEYKQLIRRLPEVFVGKAERLRVLIKIMCSAAKKCMKEKKMHLGPWRKHKYMQAKWFGTCDKSTLEPLHINSNKKPRPKASLLTCDLLDISGLHCTAVEVV